MKIIFHEGMGGWNRFSRDRRNKTEETEVPKGTFDNTHFHGFPSSFPQGCKLPHLKIQNPQFQGFPTPKARKSSPLRILGPLMQIQI